MGLFDGKDKENSKTMRRYQYDKLFSLGNKDTIYHHLRKIAHSDNSAFLHHVPIAHSAIVKPFERALGAGVRFEHYNSRLQQRLALYNVELWLKKLFISSLGDQHAALAYNGQAFITTTAGIAKRHGWPMMQLKNVTIPTPCLKELCVQVKIIDELLFDMALSGSRMFLKFDNVEHARDQESLLRQVSNLELQQSSSKMAILVGATPILTSIDSSHLIKAKAEIMRSIASVTGVPVSVLSEREDSSSVFNGTGESFERYKAHLKYIQDSILFYAYSDFINLINQTGSIESFGSFSMVSPLEVAELDKFKLYQQEVALAIEIDRYLSSLPNSDAMQQQLNQIKQKFGG